MYTQVSVQVWEGDGVDRRLRHDFEQRVHLGRLRALSDWLRRNSQELDSCVLDELVLRDALDENEMELLRKRIRSEVRSHRALTAFKDRLKALDALIRFRTLRLSP